MILTGTMITAAAGYIVNEIKKSKGAQQAADEFSTGIWHWVRPLFLEEDDEFVKDAEESPDEMKAVLEYKIKRKAIKDKEFDIQMAEWIKTKEKDNSKIIINQIHNGKGDNIGRDKIVK